MTQILKMLKIAQNSQNYLKCLKKGLKNLERVQFFFKIAQNP